MIYSVGRFAVEIDSVDGVVSVDRVDGWTMVGLQVHCSFLFAVGAQYCHVALEKRRVNDMITPRIETTTFCYRPYIVYF